MKGHIRAGAPASILLLLIATASLKGGVDPTMNIVNFKDDHGNTIGPNVAQDLLVSPNHQRSFDFLVSDGLVHSFTFTYTHEAEIQPVRLNTVPLLMSAMFRIWPGLAWI